MYPESSGEMQVFESSFQSSGYLEVQTVQHHANGSTFQGHLLQNESGLTSAKKINMKNESYRLPRPPRVKCQKHAQRVSASSTVHMRDGILTSLLVEPFWSRFLQKKWPHRCSLQCHLTMSGWWRGFHLSLLWSWNCWMGLSQHCPSSKGTWTLQCFSY